MPSIQAMQEELAGREDLVLLALNSGADDREQVSRYWDEAGFTFDAVVEPPAERGNNIRALHIRATPTNIVIGADGRVLYAGIGFDEALVRRALGLAAK